MDYKNLLLAIMKVGPNSYAISRYLGEPSTIIKSMLNNLQNFLGLRVYPNISAESLGLKKIIIFCKNSKLKIDTEKNLFVPLLNLYRADIEKKQFISVIFANENSISDIESAIKKINEAGVAECEVMLINRTVKYVRNPECFDFESGSWSCNSMYEFPNSTRQLNADKADIDLIVSLQVNPCYPYFFNPHWTHIKPAVTNFIYTLSKKDLILDVISKTDIARYIPQVVWKAEAKGLYITEIHMAGAETEKILDAVREKAEDMILAPMNISYAEGRSLPYEIFKGKTWKFPSIQIQEE
ncbi:hypothetical protein CM19_11455 [Candidatus Acidianus copahuensis]|uniref:Uncharacterized protein n=1 Tax=Candidatus Acidianus copahuensis TaxID=1160895 RepID=A0A031LKU9_9CREN|nr:hypothetical protein [Candidatus Acidianus copahuensis]EZQ02125.1 hypothetical protein CM19_11455 [Candidatus Acidianus copahuensis]